MLIPLAGDERLGTRTSVIGLVTEEKEGFLVEANH